MALYTPLRVVHHMDGGAVLVVEDEAMILLDLESALEEAGFEVVGSKNGSEAIAAFEDSPEKFRHCCLTFAWGKGLQDGRWHAISER
ncbi:hypothetical protein [Mesorhizobium sp. 128a]